MQKQLIASLVLLAGLVAGAVWFFSDPVATPAPPVSPSDRTATKEAREEVVVPAETGSGPIAAAASEVPESLFRTEVEQDGPEVRFVTIQVWDRSDGVPAAGAKVYVLDNLDAGKVDWSTTQGPFGEHWSAAAERQGRQYQAGEDGTVLVPDVRGGAVIAAELPGLYAFKGVGEEVGEDRVEVLVLQADETVTVRVVDQQARPVADAAVGILERTPLSGGFEEMVSKAREMQQTMREIKAWMDANPEKAGAARAKLDYVEKEYRAARRSAGAAKRAEAERARSAEPRPQPTSRVEVRVRRRTNSEGLAVIRHFQLYRKRADQKSGAKQGGKKQGGKKQGGKQTSGKQVATKDGARQQRKGNRGGGQKRGGAQAQKGGAGKNAYAKSKGGGWQAASTTFAAALLMPLSAPVEKEFAIDPLEEGVIVLQKPATASLALRTIDMDGRPFTHPVRGQLQMLGDYPAEWSRVMLRKEQNERTIEFPHVGLGMMFEASCRLDDDDFRWRSPQFVGPIAADERVEVDLVVAPDAGMLFARLVDGDGEPMAARKPSFLINAASGRLEGEDVVTDDEGRFHLPYKVGPDQSPPYRLEVRLGDQVPTRGMAMPLNQLPQARVSDLGDLTIAPFSEIVRGVVLDDVGAAIASANVQLQRQRPADKDGELRFVDEAFVRAEADEQGQFQLFGELEPGRYRLRVEARDHFGASVEVAGPGATCRAELLRKCRLVGTVIAPEWMRRERVRVDLTPVAVTAPTGQEMQPRRDQLHDHEGKTYAYFDWVRPGTYDLAFRLQGYPDAFLRVDGLVVEPGQVGLHPQLTDLDLGAYLYRFEIYPVDQNGQPVSVDRPQLTKVTRPSGESQFVGLVMKGPFGEVFNTQPQLEVLPMMSGYAADTQVLAAGRSELVFRRIPPVEVVLGGLGGLANDVQAQVVLERVDLNGRPEQLDAFDGMSKRIAGWYARAKYSAAMLDQDDTATVDVTGVGPHKVVVRFGVGQTKPEAVELGMVDVQVVAGGAAQRVAVPFEDEVVRQAIEAAAQRMQEGAAGGK